MTDTASQPKLSPNFLKVREALKAPLGRGWQTVPSSPGIACVRWTVEQPTPEYKRSSWPGETYSENTFVSFIYHDGRVTGTVVAERANPFVGRRDQKVSVKKALEILASH